MLRSPFQARPSLQGQPPRSIKCKTRVHWLLTKPEYQFWNFAFWVAQKAHLATGLVFARIIRLFWLTLVSCATTGLTFPTCSVFLANPKIWQTSANTRYLCCAWSREWLAFSTAMHQKTKSVVEYGDLGVSLLCHTGKAMNGTKALSIKSAFSTTSQVRSPHSPQLVSSMSTSAFRVLASSIIPKPALSPHRCFSSVLRTAWVTPHLSHQTSPWR